MTKRRIAGSRALVTGASSGIGRELCRQLSRAGSDLVLVARRAEALQELATELESHHRRAEVVAGDITDPDLRRRAVERAQVCFGGLDLLINNAGVSAHGRFSEASPERLQRILDVNFIAAAELIRISLPTLRQGRTPMVVNIGSVLGRRGVPHNSEYCASKFALSGFSEALRAELSRDGIDLLLVSPGTVRTEFFDHLIERQGDLPWAPPRGVTPEKVAQQTVRAMERGRREIVPGLQAAGALWLNRLCPRLVDRWLRRYG